MDQNHQLKTIKASLYVKVYTDEALQILKSLEAAQMIGLDDQEVQQPKVKEKKQAKSKEKLSDKLYGILSAEQAKDLNLHVEKMRNEWDRI
jgi:hypothetical protein